MPCILSEHYISGGGELFLQVNLFEYALVFLTTMLMGMVFTYILFRIMESRSKKGFALDVVTRYVRELREEEGAGRADFLVREAQERYGALFAELDLMEAAANLIVFSPEELSIMTGINRSLIDSWIKSGVISGFLTDLSGGAKKIYSLNLDSASLERIESIKNALEETARYCREYESKRVDLNQESLRSLSSLGIKNVIFIRFDNVIGPELEYFIRVTRFVKKALIDPGLVTRVVISGEISRYTEIEGGDRIVITKYEFTEEDRTLQNIMIAEVIPDADVDAIRRYLERVSQGLQGVGRPSTDDFKNALQVALG